MNNDEKIVKEMIDSLVDTNVELWEVNLDLVSNLEIIKDVPVLRIAYNLYHFGIGGEFLSAGLANIITYPGNCGYSLNESGCKFLECIFE